MLQSPDQSLARPFNVFDDEVGGGADSCRFIEVDVCSDGTIRLVGDKKTIQEIMDAFKRHGLEVRWHFFSHCG